MNHLRRVSFALILLLALSACTSEPQADLAPSATAFITETIALPLATAAGDPTPTTIPTQQVFLPIAGGPDTTPEAPDAEAAVPPTATATLEPVVTEGPTAIPTPEPVIPVYTGPPLDREDVGIQIYLHRQNMNALVRHLDALNVGWVKTQVSWKLHEPRPGEYSEELFRELDRLVEVANNHNIKLMLSVGKAPEWSRPITDEDGPPSDFGHYEAFMRYLATRYPGRVQAYELWNEPNLRREWNGMPLDPAQLVELTRRGAAGVRSVDPAALIISAAPAVTGINDGVTAIDDRVYMQGMLAAGIATVADGIGVHPYGWANPATASAADEVQKSPSHNNHPSFFFRDTMQDYHALLQAAGVTDRPLWATEFGWGTFENMLTDEGLPAAPPEGAEFMNNVSELDQATYMLDAFALAHDWEWAGPMMLWNLNFSPGIGNAFAESGYSILRSDGSRRPAYLGLEHRDD